MAYFLTNATYLATDWQSEINMTNMRKRGFYNAYFTPLIITSAPVIKNGSIIDVGGVFAYYDSDITLPNTITTSNKYYYIYNSGGTPTIVENTTSPSFDYLKLGWYHPTNTTWRAILYYDLYLDEYSYVTDYNSLTYTLNKNIGYLNEGLKNLVYKINNRTISAYPNIVDITSTNIVLPSVYNKNFKSIYSTTLTQTAVNNLITAINAQSIGYSAPNYFFNPISTTGVYQNPDGDHGYTKTQLDTIFNSLITKLNAQTVGTYPALTDIDSSGLW